jgi:5-methylcytosine-specific restriction endonuclease McrA
MQKHIKNFIKHHKLTLDEYFPCQYCGKDRAVDIHHLVHRSQGGSDEVSNLAGLCRTCHMRAHKQQEPYITIEELKHCIQS